MSTNLAYARPIPRQLDLTEPQPRRVRIVTTRAQRRARPKIVYALVAIAVIFAIFLAQLLLTIALSGGAYRISKLQSEQVQDGRVASSLSEKLDTVGSTQNLAANARALGMVASAAQAFLRLSDGKVLGHSEAAPAAPGGRISSADGIVPNSLLSGIPLVKPSSAGHGDTKAANAKNSGNDGSQSNTGDGSTGSSSNGSGSADSGSGGSTLPGHLPSPVTH